MTWVTPLGLPVLQPYRKSSTHTVRTILQSITLSLDDDALPVSKQKQRTAFPPNFVHSLDATHMLMTAIRMRDKNITFAAVHDSYWTHAQDIPAMNVVCHTAVMCMIWLPHIILVVLIVPLTPLPFAVSLFSTPNYRPSETASSTSTMNPYWKHSKNPSPSDIQMLAFLLCQGVEI